MTAFFCNFEASGSVDVIIREIVGLHSFESCRESR